MSDFRGLVLTNTILNDNDIIMNVLTDDGIISLKAKGVLKANSKNRNITEIGCYSLFHTIDKLNQNVYLLKNGESIKRFNSLNNDLNKKAVYLCLLEGFNKSNINLENALIYIDLLENTENPLCLYAFYLCYLIKNGGISLVVDECAKCSNKIIFGLSFMDGGFICKDCYDVNKHLHLDVNELKNIRYCMHADFKDYKILEKNTNITFATVKILYQFILQYGEIILKSHSFLEIIQTT